MAGGWLKSSRTPGAKVWGLFLAGILLLAAGTVLNPYVPINKKIWSDSFVLFTGGSAACALGLCLWVVDIQGLRRWAVPFLVFGTNPIVAYVASTLLNNAFKKIV